jgi:jumonji domain-containing protein 7
VVGEKTVHVKMSPNGDFEGCDDVNNWEQKEEFYIPEQVKQRLRFQDLIMVRPASLELKFEEMLDQFTKRLNYSLYMEYTSLAHFPELAQDISPIELADELLIPKVTNIWIGDGKTTGKLHFDEYDNFLVQVSGSKEILLFDPHHNENLYEGHIVEAQLSYDPASEQFLKHTLLDSTSMVMSPVDISNPNLDRFPRFQHTNSLECTIRPGDVLYLPSFWWHEVVSSPDPDSSRNIAVNYWYDPVLTKEFPCDTCKLYLSNTYSSKVPLK